MFSNPIQSTVRLVLCISLDGRIASPEGGPAKLGKSGDRKVLEESLAWADACFIGAETLRLHQSTCLIHDKQLIKLRSSEGRSLQPITVVVSRKADFSLDWDFFNQPIQRWLLSTQIPKKGFEKIIKPRNTWKESIKFLGTYGLKRFVLLGGARLAISFFADDAVDELQLTLIPKILGGSYYWFPMNTAFLDNLNCWKLLSMQRLDDNELMVHYCRTVIVC